MDTRRERNKEKRRQQILDAAELLLRERGARGLAMRRVAPDADVGEVTPYNLFASKHGLLAALGTRRTDRAAPPIRRLRSAA